MPDYENYTPGQILADASVADFIGSLGLSIADAQFQLDKNSINLISEYAQPREGLNNQSLLQLGLSPAFYHYQYADLSCEMDLRIKIEKHDEAGIVAYFNSDKTSNNNSNQSENQSSEESSNRNQYDLREASLTITAASSGAVTINNKDYVLSGSSPAEKLENLQDALTGDPASGVNRLLYQLEEPQPFVITTTASSNHVLTTQRSITFLGGGFDKAIIRISKNEPTEFVLNNADDIKVATTEQASLELYATHVRDAIREKNYDAEIVSADASAPVYNVYFATGKHKPQHSGDYENIALIAKFLVSSGQSVELEGYADRQVHASAGTTQSRNLNEVLGNNRANEVKKILMDNGVASNKIIIKPSRGQKAAETEQPNGAINDQNYRKVSLSIQGRHQHWILVSTKSGGPKLDDVTPAPENDNPLTGTTNRFIYVYQNATLDLNDKTVTIDGKTYNLSGAATNGFAVNSPEAYAKNLANLINADETNVQASATHNIVSLARDTDKFNVILVSKSTENLEVKGSSGVTVTEQFSRSSSRNAFQSSTEDRRIAYGATVDARTKRKFEMEISGNSKISARLVAIPAPVEFLDAIRRYLEDWQ